MNRKRRRRKGNRRREGVFIRRGLGILIAVAGTGLIVAFVPVQVWYIVLIMLVVLLVLILLIPSKR